MSRVRLWMLPDGTVRQTSFASQLSLAEIAAETERIAARFPPGTTWQDMETTDLPPRAERHRWRHREGQVVADPAVPDPLHPRKKVLDAIDQATTVAELKAVLKKMVAG